MKNETKKVMTIEDLAIITQQGFVGLESRMDKRFEQVEERFEDMDKQFKEMHERFRILENILYRGHDNRIEKLEDKIAQIQVILGKKLV
jgi:hypothetical protein